MSLALAIAGWSSAAVLLYAYALVSLGRLASDATAFQVMNIVGAAGLAASAAAHGAWASTVVNVLWIAIGLAVAGHRGWQARVRGRDARNLASERVRG